MRQNPWNFVSGFKRSGEKSQHCSLLRAGTASKKCSTSRALLALCSASLYFSSLLLIERARSLAVVSASTVLFVNVDCSSTLIMSCTPSSWLLSLVLFSLHKHRVTYIWLVKSVNNETTKMLFFLVMNHAMVRNLQKKNYEFVKGNNQY